MTICSKTLDEVEKRLKDHKSLREIGLELCDAVNDPRGKALRLVKMLKKDDAEKFLIENAEWLDYEVSKIRKDSPYVHESANNVSISPDAQKNLCTDNQKEIKEIICEEIKEIYKRLGIIDEMCICGHLQSQHNDTPLEKGHGSCKYYDAEFDEETEKFINKGTCSCYRFKWTNFVYNR